MDADVFVFASFDHSRAGDGQRDVVTDFDGTQDLIDLSSITSDGAYITVTLDDGEFELTPSNGSSLPDIYIYIDGHDDGLLISAFDSSEDQLDFEILLLGVTELTSDHIIGLSGGPLGM
ncbi:hypothetical protein RA26_19985 [Leisingera sp. ANG-M7]|nr:hypothetical protein RA26_19985 [Leisingera sp. ANG-M7]